jgi:hypothetical protein
MTSLPSALEVFPVERSQLMRFDGEGAALRAFAFTEVLSGGRLPR